MIPHFAVALALGFAQAAGTSPPSASAQGGAGVRDNAKLFSAPAIARGEEALTALRRASGWQILIETVDSLGGESIDRVAARRAQAANPNGLYLLISKNDHKYHALAHPRARHTFTKAGIDAVLKPLKDDLAAKDFDKALADAIEEARKVAVVSRATDERVGVRDTARMFSAAAIEKADEVFLGLHRDAGWQIIVETIESLDGQDPVPRAKAEAESSKIRGLFVLIAKAEHKTQAIASESAARVFPREKSDAIVAAFNGPFKARDFDKGLLDGTESIRMTVLPNGLQLRQSPLGGRGTDVAPNAPPRSGPAEASEKAPSKSEAGKAREAPASPPPPSEERAEAAKPNYILYAAIGLGAVAVLYILIRAVSRPAQTASPMPTQSPYAPGPGYAPPVGGAPQPPPGYAPPGRPAPPPGYAGTGRPVPPPGYAPPAPGYPPPPGYAPGGYAPAPPMMGGGGGGFVSGALGGLGGAIAGNILYDKFGRPHEAPHTHEGHYQEGHVGTGGGSAPPAPEHYEPAPRSETFDPNSGAGGSWDAPQAPAPAEEWSDAGAGGNWGGEAPAPESAAGGSWDAPQEEAGGSWGSDQPEPAAGGDWGGSSEPAVGEWSSPPDDGGTSAGGDWGDAPQESDPDQGAGGGW